MSHEHKCRASPSSMSKIAAPLQQLNCNEMLSETSNIFTLPIVLYWKVNRSRNTRFNLMVLGDDGDKMNDLKTNYLSLFRVSCFLQQPVLTQTKEMGERNCKFVTKTENDSIIKVKWHWHQNVQKEWQPNEEVFIHVRSALRDETKKKTKLGFQKSRENKKVTQNELDDDMKLLSPARQNFLCQPIKLCREQQHKKLTVTARKLECQRERETERREKGNLNWQKCCRFFS